METAPRPLTILQITTSQSTSGGTRQLLLLSEGLQAAGHRIFFSGIQGSPAVREAKGLGIEVVPLAGRALRQKWSDSRELARMARRKGVDIVHAHHTPGHNLALLASFWGSFPPVVVNRGVIFRPEFPAKFRSRRTAAIITNSLAAREVLVAAGVSRNKVHVVYNAKEPPDRTAIGLRAPDLRRDLGIARGPVIGAVGTGKPEKGFSYLIRAAPQILARHPDAVFVLVGPDTAKLVPEIRELGLADRFRVTGYRPDAVAVMGLFDVFVLPSLSESCPNVLLEAQGLGIPPVCADVGGVREILEEGRLGLLVPPADPARIAEGVCALLADPGKARTLGEMGRDSMARRFTVENKVNGTLAVYRWMVGRRQTAEADPERTERRA